MTTVRKGIHTCPTCKGRKTMTILVSELGVPGENVSSIKCVICNGEGTVDTETLDMVEFERQMWCRCGSKDHENVRYFPDNHPQGVITKHHWIHTPGCGKIVQIG